uniref:Tetracycline resistance protein, class A n=1 Tax=Noccaea caerulescens TaxID=107243 RepID=A0A1J3D763_NOCCA
MEERLGGLRHLLTTVFLSAFATFLVKPVITDVTVAAVCSDPNEACSFAVYLTGVQQVTVGLGTMIMMPVMGNLADRYGIKTLLTLPMCLTILPPAILGYRRDRNFFYAFYIIKVLFDMVCQGAVDCLAQAYVAKNIPGRKRITMFGVLGGVKSLSAICATFSARFLPVARIFQVAAISLFVGLVYMRVFLQERLHDDDAKYNEDDNDGGGDLRMLAEPILKDAPTTTNVFNNKYLSLKDMVCLMKNSTILVQALVVTFFASFSNSGFETTFLYFLKARFGFDKNDFAEILLLISIIAFISQLFILPIMVSAIGERRVLSTALLLEFFNAATLSVSWSAWVPYATTVLVPGFMLVMPSVYGIASRQVGSGEQGKIQGCIYAVKSFGEIAAPFVYSPLTALFLSENAPFYYPGFSLLCVALSMMIGFLISLLIKDVPSPSMNNAISNTSNEEA